MLRKSSCKWKVIMANMLRVVPEWLKVEKCQAGTTPLHVLGNGIKTQRGSITHPRLSPWRAWNATAMVQALTVLYNFNVSNFKTLLLLLNKNIKNNFKSRNCLRAERKGRKGWGVNPTYITMAWPQSHHRLLFLLQRQGKTPTLETR